MGRSGKGSIPFKAVAMWIVALGVGASGLRGATDEPDPKGQDAPKAEETARSKAALKAAEPYLVLLDKGKYAESWEAAAVGLRRGLPQRKWVDALSKSRKPFGKLRNRKLNRVEMVATEVPERVDQAWIYSELRFASGESCSELAIVYFENGTEWKVSGYFLGNPESFPKPKPAEKGPTAGKK